MFGAIELFRKSVDVVENELLDVDEPARRRLQGDPERYYAMLDGYRFMSFGTQIVRAVQAARGAGGPRGGHRRAPPPRRRRVPRRQPCPGAADRAAREAARQRRPGGRR